MLLCNERVRLASSCALGGHSNSNSREPRPKKAACVVKKYLFRCAAVSWFFNELFIRFGRMRQSKKLKAFKTMSNATKNIITFKACSKERTSCGEQLVCKSESRNFCRNDKKYQTTTPREKRRCSANRETTKNTIHRYHTNSYGRYHTPWYGTYQQTSESLLCTSYHTYLYLKREWGGIS
jgi:hypothetical protein